jgi:hypothetical protein
VVVKRLRPRHAHGERTSERPRPSVSLVVFLRVLLVVAVVAIAGVVGGRSAPVVPPAGEAASPSRPAARPRTLAVGLDVDVDGWVVLPDWSNVWVAGAGTLFELDDETGRVRRTGRGSWDYDHVRMARYGEGTILIVSGTTFWAVDAWSGGVVSRHDLSHLGSLDAVLHVHNSTWVAASTERGGVLARIDLDSGRALARYRIPGGLHELARTAAFLVVGSRSPGGPSIARVDPRMRSVVSLSSRPAALATVSFRAWTAADGVVRCIDVVTTDPCGEVVVPRAAALASDGRRLWVLSATGSTSSEIFEPDPAQPAGVTLLDGRTGEMLADPLDLPAATPATIAAFRGHAWVGFHEGRVLRIDVVSGRIRRANPETAQST